VKQTEFVARIRLVVLWTSLCLTGLLLGCASQPPEPIYVYQTEVLWQTQYVNVPEDLTQPVPIVYATQPEVDTIDLKVLYEEQREYAKLCNGKLAEIATLEPPKDVGNDHEQ
jgi:hypothetical protein